MDSRDGEQGVFWMNLIGLELEGTGLVLQIYYQKKSVQPQGSLTVKFMTSVLQGTFSLLQLHLLTSSLYSLNCKASPSFLSNNLALGFAQKDTVQRELAQLPLCAICSWHLSFYSVPLLLVCQCPPLLVRSRFSLLQAPPLVLNSALPMSPGMRPI